MVALLPLLGALSVGAAAGSLAAGLYLLINSSREQERLGERLRWAAGRPTPPSPGPLSALANRFDSGPWGQTLQKELIRSNLELRPAFFALAVAALFALAWFFLGRVMQLQFPLDLSLAALAARMGPAMALKARRQRLADRLGAQLSELARRLGASLRAGLTVPQAIERVARELTAPAGPLLRRVDGELKLGRPLASALDTLVERADIQEVRILVTTILLQYEMGGDLAGALEAMARTLAQRQVVAREVAAVTAEARSVSGILPFMPLLAAVFLNLFMPGLLNVLFTPVGLVLLAVFVVIQAVALVIIRSLAAIRV